MENSQKKTETMLVLTLASLVLYYWLGYHWLLQAALILAFIGIFSPFISIWIHYGWMLLAKGLGWFNGRILLSIVFFIIVTPIAILTRKARSKSLIIKKITDPSVTYYTERNHLYQAKDLENTF